MNEQFVVRLLENDQQVPFTDIVMVELDGGGVVLNGETSAWPRGLRFDFEGVGAFKEALNLLRRQTADGDHRFGFRLSNGDLVITTIAPNRIPTGSYDLDLRVADIDLNGPVEPIQVEEGTSPVVIRLQAQPERQRIVQAETINTDEPIASIVQGISRIDGRPMMEWLGAAGRRAKRKACLLNLLAALRTIPSPETHMLRHVEQVFHVDVDRIYAKVNPTLLRFIAGAGFRPDSAIQCGPWSTAPHTPEALASYSRRGPGRVRALRPSEFPARRTTECTDRDCSTP
jgi:hypothetical protein